MREFKGLNAASWSRLTFYKPLKTLEISREIIVRLTLFASDCGGRTGLTIHESPRSRRCANVRVSKRCRDDGLDPARFFAALDGSERQVGSGHRRHWLFRQAFHQDGHRPIQTAPADRVQPRRIETVRDGAGI